MLRSYNVTSTLQSSSSTRDHSKHVTDSHNVATRFIMAAATQIAIKNRHKMAGRRPETRLPHLNEANETYVETVGKCCTCLRSSPCWDCLTHSEAWLCVCLPCICCTRCLSAYSSKHAIVVHDTRPHPRCPSSQQLRQSSSPQVNAIQR